MSVVSNCNTMPWTERRQFRAPHLIPLRQIIHKVRLIVLQKRRIFKGGVSRVTGNAAGRWEAFSHDEVRMNGRPAVITLGEGRGDDRTDGGVTANVFNASWAAIAFQQKRRQRIITAFVSDVGSNTTISTGLGDAK